MPNTDVELNESYILYTFLSSVSISLALMIFGPSAFDYFVVDENQPKFMLIGIFPSVIIGFTLYGAINLTSKGSPKKAIRHPIFFGTILFGGPILLFIADTLAHMPVSGDFFPWVGPWAIVVLIPTIPGRILGYLWFPTCLTALIHSLFLARRAYYYYSTAHPLRSPVGRGTAVHMPPIDGDSFKRGLGQPSDSRLEAVALKTEAERLYGEVSKKIDELKAREKRLSAKARADKERLELEALLSERTRALEMLKVRIKALEKGNEG